MPIFLWNLKYYGCSNLAQILLKETNVNGTNHMITVDYSIAIPFRKYSFFVPYPEAIVQ